MQMYSALVAGAVRMSLSLWFVRGLGVGDARVILGKEVSPVLSVIGQIKTFRVIRRSVNA